MLKFSITALLALAFAFAPAMWADPISTMTQNSMDTGVAISVTRGHSVDLLGGLLGGGGSSTVPEPGTAVPLVLLASGLWFVRKLHLAK